ncbi:hypothetical protein BV25DRAFT_1844273 [Artomyces pyxidatus]|uniref:Uncharacterized protein n=1 Tax=Artomyces pyxidatus TaxID=48021 RepID=A0ACB8TJQ1_9AGAM|nr:hypothetical protein BV25DRAFT_1844273 [Artomyces pyxidatus]
MKVNVSEEELNALQNASIRGLFEGFFGGLAISLPASFYAQRRFAGYRALPIHLKALAVIFVTAPAIAIRIEQRGIEFDEERHWTGATKMVLDQARAKQNEDPDWARLSLTDKFSHWVQRNQYKFILGSWAATMAVAGTIIMRDKHQSTSQKVVQARMWAQGLTIGVLVTAGILTHSQREEAAKHHPVDHSWRDLLEAEAREAEQRKIKQLSPSTPL